MLSLPKKKKSFLHFLCIPQFLMRPETLCFGTHNERDKALLNVCLPSLTCWDKFHITPSTPGENVIRGLECLHTNKRSVPPSLSRHKASIWKWACFFRPGLNGLKHYPSHTGWSGYSLRREFTKAQPWLHTASSKSHRKRPIVDGSSLCSLCPLMSAGQYKPSKFSLTRLG